MSLPRFLAAALLLFASLAAPAAARASEADERKTTPLPFEPTEQLVYEGDFSKYLLRGIKIAEFTFTVGRDTSTDPLAGSGYRPEKPFQAGTPRLRLVGDVKSDGWFRKLFGINFHFRVESLVERETFAVLRSSELDEQGKRVRTSESIFDRGARMIVWTEKDPNDPTREPRVVTSPLDGVTHDLLTAIYFLRTQTLTPGRSLELVLSDSGRLYRVPATVSAERKAMKTAVGKVQVVRVDVELFGEGRPLQGDGHMSMWVTADARRIPVRARMSSDMGQLDIKLKRHTTAPPAAAEGR